MEYKNYFGELFMEAEVNSARLGALVGLYEGHQFRLWNGILVYSYDVLRDGTLDPNMIVNYRCNKNGIVELLYGIQLSK